MTLLFSARHLQRYIRPSKVNVLFDHAPPVPVHPLIANLITKHYATAAMPERITLYSAKVRIGTNLFRRICTTNVNFILRRSVLLPKGYARY